MRLGDLDDLKVHISELMLVYSGTELDNAILNAIDNAPTVEYTFEEAFQKTICEQRLYCPKRPQGECEKCTYRIFTEKFTDGVSEVMALYGITSIEELQDRLQAETRGGADMRKGGES